MSDFTFYPINMHDFWIYSGLMMYIVSVFVGSMVLSILAGQIVSTIFRIQTSFLQSNSTITTASDTVAVDTLSIRSAVCLSGTIGTQSEPSVLVISRVSVLVDGFCTLNYHHNPQPLRQIHSTRVIRVPNIICTCIKVV